MQYYMIYIWNISFIHIYQLNAICKISNRIVHISHKPTAKYSIPFMTQKLGYKPHP